MCGVSVLLCTTLACAVQVELKTLHEVEQGNPNGLEMPSRNLNREQSGTKMLREFTDLGPQALGSVGLVADDRKIFKREAKKPKNTKRRKKFSKKKMQEQDKSESDTKSEKSKSESTEESKTAPDSESSDDSDYTSSDSSDDTDESDDHSSEDSEDESGTTEEVSLSSEDESESSPDVTEEIYSGPDSSSPSLSDSTDESSASRAISGGSSETSYTMSSSAEDAFPTINSDSSGDKSEKETEDNSKSAEKSKEKSKATSKPGEKSKASSEPKVTTKVKKKKGKKITEIKIKLDKNKQKKEKATQLTSKDKTTNKKNKISIKAKGKKPESKKKLKTKKELKSYSKDKLNLKASDKLKLETKNKPPQHLSFTTERVLNMAARLVAGNKVAVGASVVTGNKVAVVESPASKGKPKMEMLKVKKAEPSKKNELEQELLKDYPENGTVEIVNWEGTFSPIHGEPYVAPVHHQPDSFWDAIYRSTDPDLPTPPGVDISIPVASSPSPTTWKRPVITSLHPDLKRFVYVTNEETSSEYEKRREGLEMKNKDKGKKEKKKPKLSPKEKKKKKREGKEKENPNNFARAPGKIKLDGIRGEGKLQIHAYTEPHVAGNQRILVAARKSEENLKPPTLPEDHRFGQEQSRAGAGLSPKIDAHTQLHKPGNQRKLVAARKSEENLKTPSEEERESGTTYKPEGAYEYPSFRHPDFNPDTAYDENGIPIHESPGWTPPPTLPGDHRFGKERSRAGAGLSPKVKGVFDQHADDLAAHQNMQHPMNLHANIAVQEEHHEAHPVLPPEHIAVPKQDRAANHKIRKRKVALSESLEKDSLSVSRVMTTQELNTAAEKHRKQQFSKEYKAYKLTDSEMKNKEDSAPLEALNPALYMHKNMFEVKKKSRKNHLPGVPDDAEVIALVVSPQDKQAMKTLSKLGFPLPNMAKKKKPIKQVKPIVYNRHNEAQNPHLYKYRNIFKVRDLKDDGLKVNKELLAQMALNQAHQKEMAKAVPMEDYLNEAHALKGRGRENFNPIFINQNKLLHVKTNKFKATSVEHNLAKRETKDDLSKEAARPRPHIPKPPPPPPDPRPHIMTEPAYKM